MEYNFRNDTIWWQMTNLQVIFFTVLILAKVWPVWTIVIQTHTDTETDKPIGIDKFLQVCLKMEESDVMLTWHHLTSVKGWNVLPEWFPVDVHCSWINSDIVILLA